MRYFRTLVSAFTIFGGHFLNHRLDRVILFFALLSLIGLASYLVLPGLLLDVFGTTSAFMHWLVRLPVISIGALAIASAIVTWFDAPSEATLTNTMRVSGVLISLFGLLIMGLGAMTTLLNREPAHSARGPSDDRAPLEQKTSVLFESFQTSIHLGGGIRRWDLPAPPKGPHLLRGRVLIDGKPAEDVQLFLFLNEKFRTDTLFTNEAGEFQIGLPAGTWYINQVTADRWDSAPNDRRLTLFSQFEPRLGNGTYSRHSYRRRAGHRIELPSDADILLELALRDAIKAQWPARADMFRAVEGDVDVANGDSATSKIAWEPVATAVQYEIQINRLVKTEDSMISYKPMPIVRQTDTSLPLASLQRRTAEPSALERYSIEIYAFDKDGQLLAETDGGPSPLMFELSGPNQLAEVRSEYGGSTDVGEPRSAEYIRNVERLSLASMLIDQKQLGKARKLLGEVTEDAPSGRKLALLAGIAALSGDCATALPLFEQAQAEGGSGCVKPAHLELCGAH